MEPWRMWKGRMVNEFSHSGKSINKNGLRTVSEHEKVDERNVKPQQATTDEGGVEWSSHEDLTWR